MKIAYNPTSATALSAAPDGSNDIIFDLKGLNIFAKGVKFKGTDTTYQVFKKHTSANNEGGNNGLVPVPSYTTTNIRFLREDGTWLTISTGAYSQLNNTDLDTLKTEGKWYYIAGSSSNTNGPTNFNAGGELYIGRNAAGYRYLKVITLDGKVWIRIWNNSAWGEWTRWETTDYKVTQNPTTTDKFKPIVLGYNDLSVIDDSVTEQVHVNSKIYAQPSTGTIYATKFQGLLDWANILNKPTSFNPTTHTHTSNQITALTSYTKGTADSALTTTDTLNSALGKLEYKGDLGVAAYNIVKAASDGDGTIENLNEILKVLQGISDTDTIKNLLGKYLPLSGGTMTGTAMIRWADSGNWPDNNANITFPVVRGGLQWNGLSDYVKLQAVESAVDKLDLVLQFGDDNNNELSIRKKDNTQVARITANGLVEAMTLKKTNGTADLILLANGEVTSLSGLLGPIASSNDANLTLTVGGTSKSIVTLYSGVLRACDIRDTNHLPSSVKFEAKTLTAFFNNTGMPIGGAWFSGINVKGHTTSYQTWLLASGSNTTLHGKLYYRNGMNDSWESWKLIAFTNDITEHYWANIKISATSNNRTTPTFGNTTVAGQLQMRPGDASLAVYAIENSTAPNGTETLAIQSCFDNTDPITSGYVTLYASRSILALLPRGGKVAIGLSGASYPLHVGGLIGSTGFVKADSSNSYVLLGGGGHKAISEFMLKSEELTSNLITVLKSLIVTKAWMDTGINNSNIKNNGTYIVQVSVHAGSGGGNMWYCCSSGIMSWYKDATNDTEADEIILHRTGHAYHNTIYLRTLMQTNGVLKLLIAANADIGAAYTYTFKFKRVI